MSRTIFIYSPKTTGQKTMDELDKAREQIAELLERFPALGKEMASFAKVLKGSATDWKKQLEGLNKDIAKNRAGYKEQLNMMERLTDAIEEEIEAAEKLTDAKEKEERLANAAALAEKQRELAKEAAWQQTKEAMGDFTEKSLKTAFASTGAFVKGLQNGTSAAQLQADMLSGAVDIIGSGANTLAKGAQGAGQAMAMSVNPIVAGVGGIVSGLSAIGQAAIEAGKKVAKFGIEVAVKEVEKTTKVFNSMSSAGAMMAGGMTEMRNAANASGLSLEQFSAVVKGNSEELGKSGLGVAEGARQMGRVGKIMKDTGIQTSLLNLGYGFEEQAELTAKTVANMRRTAGGMVSDRDVAEQTQKYAENLRLIASITGEDAKKKAEAIGEENRQLAFEQKVANMSVEQRAQLNAAMATMTEQERKNFRDRVVLGQVVNREGAIYEATISGARQKGEAALRLFEQNALTAETNAELNKQFGAQIKQSALNQKEIATAAFVGVGNLEGIAKAGSDAINQANTYTAEAIAKGAEGMEGQEQGQDKLQKSLIGAEREVQNFRIALEKILTDKILENYAIISKKMLEVASKVVDIAMGNEGGGGMSAAEQAQVKEARGSSGIGYLGMTDDAVLRKLKQDEWLKSQGITRTPGGVFLGPKGENLGLFFDKLPGAPEFDKGGTIKSGQVGVVGERGPEFVSGPANVLSRVSTEKLITVLDAIRELQGIRFGENDFDWQVGMQSERWGELKERTRGFENIDYTQIQSELSKRPEMADMAKAREAMNRDEYEPIKNTNLNSADSKEMTDALQEQNGLLRKMLDTLSDNNRISGKILQNSL